MLLALGLIVLGLALLVAGGEFLVRGASGLALLARVSAAVVGLTVVAAGTSMPELVVSLLAAFRGSPALAIGNVVGSNIFNIGMILGVAALIRPLLIQGNTVRLEWPVMILAAFQLHLLARDGLVDRLEGGFLLLGLVVFVAYVVWVARNNAIAAELQQFQEATVSPLGGGGLRAWWLNTGAVAAGIALLGVGASSLVSGAVTLARTAGLSEVIIGLTIVAAGTSLPELATSAVAAWRGENEIAVANIVGSNIFNSLGIVGATGLVHPLPVPEEILVRDNWWMLGFSALLFPLMRSGMRITRLEGCLLLLCFGAYMVVLFRSL